MGMGMFVKIVATSSEVIANLGKIKPEISHMSSTSFISGNVGIHKMALAP